MKKKNLGSNFSVEKKAKFKIFNCALFLENLNLFHVLAKVVSLSSYES